MVIMAMMIIMIIMTSKVRKCSWWMPNLTFSNFKIDESGKHQIECILKDKFISVLKITYIHHPWGQERPPWLRKAISGTFLIHYFLDIYISVVCQCVRIFKDKSNDDDDNDNNDDNLQSQEVFLMDSKSNFLNFQDRAEVVNIKLIVFWKANPLVYSKSLMDIILGARNNLHASGRLHQENSWSTTFFTYK